MKKILIIGENSYVGRSFKHHVRDLYIVNGLSVRNDNWCYYDFSGYDVVIHLAAIVHNKKKLDKDLYYRVNRDIPFLVCRQATMQGVKHFIFLSSMAVYGFTPSRIGQGKITLSTEFDPKTVYGASKLAAEHALQLLQKEKNFLLSIVRPPMIYGRGCPGKFFNRLLWMGRFFPLFPTVRENRLSMIGIGNLCELLRLIIENSSSGFFCPQDQDAFGTQARLKVIAEVYRRNIYMAKTLGLPLQALPLSQLDSLYGNLYYADEFNHFDGKYFIDSFFDTIKIIKNY